MTRVLDVTGSKAQETVEKFGGRVVRAIFVIEEANETSEMAVNAGDQDVEKRLTEMDAHAVSAGGMDDSREAIYTRLEGK